METLMNDKIKYVSEKATLCKKELMKSNFLQGNKWAKIEKLDK